MTQELFDEFCEWQKETFPSQNPISKIHHLKQEVEELLLDVSSKAPDRRLEFADCFMLLFGAAAADGMTYKDIISAFEEKLKINKNRKWGKPDENGVVNHVKNS